MKEQLWIAILLVILSRFYSKRDSHAWIRNRDINNRHSNKELCTDMKQYPSMENGAFITRDPGVWRYRKDGSRYYDIETCQIKRFSAEEARQCLAGRHMLLIGDSLQRYLFITLVHFIEHGNWPSRFPMGSSVAGSDAKSVCKHIDGEVPTCSPPGFPNIATENDWSKLYGHAADRSWKYMQKYIGGEGFNGRVECQCARLDSSLSTNSMFYESSSFFGGNSSVKISYISNLADIPIHLWKRSYCEKTGSCEMSEEKWRDLRLLSNNRKWDVDERIVSFLNSTIYSVAPDVDIAIYNRGLWGGNPPREFLLGVMNGLFRLVTKNNGKCFWKGVSPSWSVDNVFNGYPDAFAARDEDNRRIAYESGCGVFDMSHVTKDFAKFQWKGDIGRNSCCGEKEMKNVYFDAAHFQPWVNEEINQILLNVLC